MVGMKGTVTQGCVCGSLALTKLPAALCLYPLIGARHPSRAIVPVTRAHTVDVCTELEDPVELVPCGRGSFHLSP
jgi:hypothetical protein